MNQGALATVNDDEIINRIAKGEYQSHIARSLGVAPQSLHERISKRPEYKLALESRNLAKLDQAQERIETAPDLARVSMAAHEFKAAAWRAERECPATWGQQTANITINNNVLQISDSLIGRAGDLLNQLRVVNAVKIEEKP